METDAHGGILRLGAQGSYTYEVEPGFENDAVNFVSFFDALRFANWIHNGEGNGDTETGTYTLLGGTATPSNGSTVVRNPGASVALPSQDEWFKAAYYDAALEVYYHYPAGSDTPPDCGSPSATPNKTNCGNSAIRGVTPVGAYTRSPSPYGTFDQGGNVAEWNEDVVFGGGRAVRGGGWTGLTTPLAASSVSSLGPSRASSSRGFRLVLLEGADHSRSIGVFGSHTAARWTLPRPAPQTAARFPGGSSARPIGKSCVRAAVLLPDRPVRFPARTTSGASDVRNPGCAGVAHRRRIQDASRKS